VIVQREHRFEDALGRDADDHAAVVLRARRQPLDDDLEVAQHPHDLGDLRGLLLEGHGQEGAALGRDVAVGHGRR